MNKAILFMLFGSSAGLLAQAVAPTISPAPPGDPISTLFQMLTSGAGGLAGSAGLFLIAAMIIRHLLGEREANQKEIKEQRDKVETLLKDQVRGQQEIIAELRNEIEELEREAGRKERAG